MHHFTQQSASFHAVKYGRLRNDLHQSILPLVINIITTPNKLIRHYKYPDMQRLRRCAYIRMDVFAMMNVLTTQRRRCYVGIPMNVFIIMNVTTTQRCKRCTSDSPGLASKSEGYPGSFAASGNNAVGVVPFIPRHFIATFHAENVQHLRRCSPHYIHNPG